MNKELKDAKEYINYQIKTGNLVRGYTDIYYFQEELKILLNYIENSISKEKIIEKLKELDKEEKEAQDSISDEEREEYSDSSIGYLLVNIETRREVLKELLEEK